MKRILQLLIIVLAALALWACGGSGSSDNGSGDNSGQLGSFKFTVAWPSGRAIPPQTHRFHAQLRHNGVVVGETDVVVPDSEGSINNVPAGDTTAQVYAYDSSDNLLGSGSSDFFIKPNAVSSTSVTVDSLPGQVDNQRYIIGGSVGPVEGNPDLLQITLPALIDRTDGTAAEGLTDQNFIVLEDNIRKLPITVTPVDGHFSKADIAVCLDTTGSMGGSIAGVRDSVQAFADAIAASGIDVRFGGIEFGDDMRSQIDFTSDTSAFKSWVAGLSAYGGGDLPENPLDAIMTMANKTNWRPDAQPIILVITDIYAHSADDVTPRTVDSVIQALRGRFVCHVVAPGAGGVANRSNGVGQDRASKGATNVEYIDRIATETGGVWTPFPYGGGLDLTHLPIADTIKKGYLVTFTAHKYDVDHEIRLIVNDGAALLADQIFHGHYSPSRK